MFEKSTERARRVIFFARYEASRLGSPAIEPEHLFLGILREGGPAAGHLRANGFDLDDLRRKTEETYAPSGLTSTSVDIPLSGPAREVLDIAVEEGRAHSMGAVDAEEILVGIFREGRNAAARLLAEGRFDVTGLRRHARATLGAWPCRRCGEMTSPAVVEPRLRVRLDPDGSTAPLVSLAAAVCAHCGLVELDVDDPGRLRDR